MAVPGTKPQDFAAQTASLDDDRIPFIKDPGGTPLDSYIVPGDFLSSRGALAFQGDWNASTNSPTLVSSTGTKGFIYRISTDGATTLDGINVWKVDDLIYFDGSVWRQSISTRAASLLVNDSGVTGTTIADALDNLDAASGLFTSESGFVFPTDTSDSVRVAEDEAFFVSSGVISDVSQQSLTTSTGQTDAWQSYTATKNGHLIEVQFGNSQPDSKFENLVIYEGEGIGGAVLASDNSVNLIGDPSSYKPSAAPFQVAGQKYTVRRIHVSGPTQGWELSTSNPYGGGRASLNAGWDFVFETFIVEQISKLSKDTLIVNDLERLYQGAKPTIGAGGTFSNVAAAIAASVFDVKAIADITDSADITLPANQDFTMDVGTFTWNTGDMIFLASGTSRVKFVGDGTLVSTLTTGGKVIFNMVGTSRLNLSGFRTVDTTANSGALTGIASFSTTSLCVSDNTIFLLSNNAACGFNIFPNDSRLTSCTFIGGGSLCAGVISNGQNVLISNLTLDGTFNANQGPFFMTFDGAKGPILTNFINRSNNVWIRTESPQTQIANLQDNFSIDLDVASDCTITDSNLTDLDMTESACIDNDFKGVDVVNDITIGGNGNRGTNNRFTGNLVIDGNNNHFSLTTAASVTDNGSGNFVSNSAAEGGVTSVFTRDGDVVATLNDYNASQVNNDSAVSGATVKEALENAAAGGALSQVQTFYQGLAGNDGGNGTSIETPRLTLGSILTLIGTPTVTNPVELNMIGGQVNSESFVFPPYLTINAPGVKFTGIISFTNSIESRLIAKEILVAGSTTAIVFSGSVFNGYLDVDLISSTAASATAIAMTNGGEFRCNVRKVSMFGVGSKFADVNASALFLETHTFRENVPSVEVLGGFFFFEAIDGNPNGDWKIRNLNGGGNIELNDELNVTINGVNNLSLGNSNGVSVGQAGIGRFHRKPESFLNLTTTPVSIATFEPGVMYFITIVTPDLDKGSFVFITGEDVGGGASRFLQTAGLGAAVAIAPSGGGSFVLTVSGYVPPFVIQIDQSDNSATFLTQNSTATGTTLLLRSIIDPN